MVVFRKLCDFKMQKQEQKELEKEERELCFWIAKCIRHSSMFYCCTCPDFKKKVVSLDLDCTKCKHYRVDDPFAKQEIKKLEVEEEKVEKWVG